MSDLQIVERLSPNCGPRRNGLRPTLVVLHYTAMENAGVAIARLCDPAAEVSAHYLIAADGVVTRMVAEDLRAWHAGAGTWQGQEDINSRSIGIELDNRGDHPFAAAMMEALEGLLREIMARWDIPPAGIIGHSDMAPGRKVDPGPHFDWARLARQGLAAPIVNLAVNEPVDPQHFGKVAKAAGYSADIPHEILLHSTRLRSAPWRTGPVTAADYALPQG